MLYDYKCTSCHLVREISKPMSEASRDEYCKCGMKLQRLYNVLGVVWGLGGWDYDKEGMGDELILRHND